MMGVNAFEDSAVVVRGRIKTLPGKQWMTGRAYNEIIKEIFDERGIEIPFPHMTLYAGEDKNGESPAFRVLSKRERGSAASPPAETVEEFIEETAEEVAPSAEESATAAESETIKSEATEAALSDLTQDIPEESGRKPV